MSGAGIMLVSGDVPLGSVGTTGTVSARIDDLQFTLGEGPSVDAHASGRPVLEPDLAHPASPRWLAFTGAAIDAGARAVFGFPIAIGSVRVGALSLDAEHPGGLSDDQHADALVSARIAAEAVLAMQAKGEADLLVAELEDGSNFQYVVHQAAGMVSAQLDVTVTEALLRLRAHAFDGQRLLADVATDVVSRRVRFSASDG